MLNTKIILIIIISISFAVQCSLFEPEIPTGSLKIILVSEKSDKSLKKQAELLNTVQCIVKKGSKEKHNNNLTLQGNSFHGEITGLETGSDYSVLLYGKNSNNFIIARGYESEICVKVNHQETVTISWASFVPELISPQNSVTINNDKPGFKWNDVNGATEYEIQIDNSNEFTSSEIQKAVITDSNYTSTASLPNGNYYWRVRANDEQGSWGNWSIIFSFVSEKKEDPPESFLVTTGYMTGLANTSIKIDLVEEGGYWKHHLEHGQIYFWSPFNNTILKRLSLALEMEDGLIHYFWLPQIKSVKYISSSSVYQLSMTNGQEFKGEWVSSHFHLYYHEDKEEKIYGKIMQNDTLVPAYLPVSKVLSLTIDGSALDLQALFEKEFSPKHPLLVRLKDGREFDGFHGYIVDYCGHWASTRWHKRLDDKLLYWENDVTQDYTESNAPQSISIEEIKEIKFTSNFGQNLLSCREAILWLRNGKEIVVFIELTTESHVGKEKHWSSYRQYDSILLLRNSSNLILQLDSVDTIFLK